jgi:redox-sensitive bicupin YhaK (pirin superfamily)
MKRFTDEERRNQLRHYVSGRDESSDAMAVNQDVDIYAALLSKNNALSHTLDTGRGAWIQAIQGSLQINDETTLEPGDGAGIEGIQNLEMKAVADCEFILFDVAMDFQTPYRLNNS